MRTAFVLFFAFCVFGVVVGQGTTASPTTSAPTTDPPTPQPTPVPTPAPSYEPTKVPTPAPSYEPTTAPTYEPTKVPTPVPTTAPTYEPTKVPTPVPTAVPATPAPATPTSGSTPTPATPTSTPASTPTTTPTPATPTSGSTPTPGTPAPAGTPTPGTPSPPSTPTPATPAPAGTPTPGTPAPAGTPTPGTPAPAGTPTPGTPAPAGTPTPGTPAPAGTPTPGTPAPAGTPTPGTPAPAGTPTPGTPSPPGTGTPTPPTPGTPAPPTTPKPPSPPTTPEPPATPAPPTEPPLEDLHQGSFTFGGSNFSFILEKAANNATFEAEFYDILKSIIENLFNATYTEIVRVALGSLIVDYQFASPLNDTAIAAVVADIANHTNATSNSSLPGVFLELQAFYQNVTGNLDFVLLVVANVTDATAEPTNLCAGKQTICTSVFTNVTFPTSCTSVAESLQNCLTATCYNESRTILQTYIVNISGFCNDTSANASAYCTDDTNALCDAYDGNEISSSTTMTNPVMAIAAVLIVAVMRLV